jgi:hypothetical protein
MLSPTRPQPFPTWHKVRYTTPPLVLSLEASFLKVLTGGVYHAVLTFAHQFTIIWIELFFGSCTLALPYVVSLSSCKSHIIHSNILFL